MVLIILLLISVKIFFINFSRKMVNCWISSFNILATLIGKLSFNQINHLILTRKYYALKHLLTIKYKCKISGTLVIWKKSFKLKKILNFHYQKIKKKGFRVKLKIIRFHKRCQKKVSSFNKGKSLDYKK